MPLDHRIRSRGLRRWDSWTECLGIFAFFKKFKRVAATATPRGEFRGGAHRARVQNAIYWEPRPNWECAPRRASEHGTVRGPDAGEEPEF